MKSNLLVTDLTVEQEESVLTDLTVEQEKSVNGGFFSDVFGGFFSDFLRGVTGYLGTTPPLDAPHLTATVGGIRG